MTEQTKAGILVGLVAVFGWLWFFNPFETGEKNTGRSESRDTRKKKTLTDADIPTVDFLDLHARGQLQFERDRDLFKYAKSPAELEAERRRREEEERRRREEEERRRRMEEERRKREAEEARRRALLAAQRARDKPKDVPKPVEPDEPPPPEPPDFTYKYVGIIGPRADAFAILTNEKDKYSYAKAGDVVDESFRVERVGRLNLDLSFTDPLFTGRFDQVPRTFTAKPKAEEKEEKPGGRRRSRRR